MRSAGLAFNEVVIAHADEPGAEAKLHRFAWGWGMGFTLALGVIATTPLADLWFQDAMGLDPKLADLGVAALWLAVPLPILTFLQSHWQGLLVHQHRTRAVTGSVGLFLIVTVLIIVAGVLIGRWSGLEVTLFSFTVGNAAQLFWLRYKWRIEGGKSPEQPEMGTIVPEPF
jgi:O-antigen/teichoic acid export membrane protein